MVQRYNAHMSIEPGAVLAPEVPHQPGRVEELYQRFLENTYLRGLVIGGLALVQVIELGIGLSYAESSKKAAQSQATIAGCQTLDCLFNQLPPTIKPPTEKPIVKLPTKPKTVPKVLSKPTTTSTVPPQPAPVEQLPPDKPQARTEAAALPVKLPLASLGFDIGWPPSNDRDISTEYKFGIINLDGGRPFTDNPYLAAQISRFRERSLDFYVNTEFHEGRARDRQKNDPNFVVRNTNPNFTERQRLAYNYGYNAGKYDAKKANGLGIYVKRIWLDIETANSWDKNCIKVDGDDCPENRLSAQGQVDGFRENYDQKDVIFGFYSAVTEKRNMFREIFGDTLEEHWMTESPAWWRPGGMVDTFEEALPRCQEASFTGGELVYVQFVKDGLDQNIAC